MPLQAPETAAEHVVRHEGGVYVHGDDTYDAFLERHQGMTCVAYDPSFGEAGILLSDRAMGLLATHHGHHYPSDREGRTQWSDLDMERY
ncbi:hypothetical protein KIPB_007484, partial [Kipferlia bialata]|eukprot:g7484.t1